MKQGELGARLRAAREMRGVSLRSLAAEIGVSPSLISQIENGKVNPSVDTLYALVRHLGISIDTAFEPDLGLSETSAFPGVSPIDPQLVIESSDASAVLEMNNGVRWQRLAVLPGIDLEALLVTYEAGASSSVNGRLMRHLGYEHFVLIEGELTMKYEFESYVIRSGDSVAFNAQQPHQFANVTKKKAVGVWYILGQDTLAKSSGASQERMDRQHL